MAVLSEDTFGLCMVPRQCVLSIRSTMAGKVVYGVMQGELPGDECGQVEVRSSQRTSTLLVEGFVYLLTRSVVRQHMLFEKRGKVQTPVKDGLDTAEDAGARIRVVVEEWGALT